MTIEKKGTCKDRTGRSQADVLRYMAHGRRRHQLRYLTHVTGPAEDPNVELEIYLFPLRRSNATLLLGCLSMPGFP